MPISPVVWVSVTILGYAVQGVIGCHILAVTESGWVCGTERPAENGAPYASFRGIPYAKQPIGELRFQELQPLEPWDGILDATTEGPSCYQDDVFFGNLMVPQGLSEACIHANVHVPSHALPSPYEPEKTSGGLPIFVFWHGGGWVCGSGDADINGPEFLVSHDVIVITFNYRLDLFGFMSLNSTKVPGNAGLRDAVTLLRWVQRNARRFGGDPDNVTLSGQSAGSKNAHLLSLSPVAKGLFKRVWLMSGTVITRNFVTTQEHAKTVTNTFLKPFGLNGSDPDYIHDQLVKMPIEDLFKNFQYAADKKFMPVQEPDLPGVTRIIEDAPDKLLAKGYGDDIPLVVGYTNSECETMRRTFIKINIVQKCKENPLALIPIHQTYTLPYETLLTMVEKLVTRYFPVEPTLEEYIRLCTESSYADSTLRFVRDRKARGGAPLFLYKFSYDSDYSAIKLAFNITYDGAGHMEDMNNILKVNAIAQPRSSRDLSMKYWLSSMVANFVKTGYPSPGYIELWPPESANEPLKYLEIVEPFIHQYKELSDSDRDMMQFFDKLGELE